MKYLPPAASCRAVSIALMAVAILAAGVIGIWTTPADSSAAALVSVAMGTAAVGQAPVDSANVMGHAKCAECHKSEVAAWHQSPHAMKSFQKLSAANAPKYASAMGITGDLTKSLCANCHATTHAGGVFQGVSCEVCHNAAGPPRDRNGWFSIHSHGCNRRSAFQHASAGGV